MKLRNLPVVGRLADFVEWRYRELVRPHLPRTQATYNGVQVRAEHVFDGFLPFNVGHPEPSVYEAGIISGLRKNVTTGDSVVIVGGGNGVSAVVAARCVGPSGSVHVFEGAAEYADRVRETVVLNGVDDRVEVEHAIVGEAIQLRGGASGAERISPGELPECDVLELDCEGMELDIIRSISFRPRAIIVETHGFLGSSSTKVKSELRQHSYEISTQSVADPALNDICNQKDIRALVAVQ